MNIVHTELATASYATAILVATIVANLNYQSRVKNSYYSRSRTLHGRIKKSYIVTWRLLNSIALVLLLPCYVAVIYAVSGFAFNSQIYDIDKDIFRFFMVVPVLVYWLFVLLSLLAIRFIWYVTKPSDGDELEKKLEEFASSVAPLEMITEPTFRPGQVCVAGGTYKVIEGYTRTKKGEIKLRKGQQFPSLSNGSMYYVKID